MCGRGTVQLSNFCLLTPIQVLPLQMRFTPYVTNYFCCTTSYCMNASKDSSTPYGTGDSCEKWLKQQLWRNIMLPWWVGTQPKQRFKHTTARTSVNWFGQYLSVLLGLKRSLISHSIKITVCGTTCGVTCALWLLKPVVSMWLSVDVCAPSLPAPLDNIKGFTVSRVVPWCCAKHLPALFEEVLSAVEE